MQTFSITAMAIGGVFVAYELFPRAHARDRTPEEYAVWIEQKKSAGHEEAEMPGIVSALRLKLVNERIEKNLGINNLKSRAPNRGIHRFALWWRLA